VFTEDYRITGDSLQEQMFFHVDAGKLESVLEHLRDGRTIDGENLPEPLISRWARGRVAVGQKGSQAGHAAWKP
jgi:hypothetical protein